SASSAPAKYELAHGGMQSVGANHEVELPRRRVREADDHPIRGLLQRRDALGEKRLHPVFHQLVDAAREIATRDAQEPVVAGGAEHPRVESRDAPAPGVHQADFLNAIAVRLEHRQQPHALGHVVSHTPEVDHVPARPRRGRALDERGDESDTLQTVRQRRTGNARARDENGARPMHRGALALHVRCIFRSSAVNRALVRSGAKRNDPPMPYTAPERDSYACSRRSMARSCWPSPVYTYARWYGATYRARVSASRSCCTP